MMTFTRFARVTLLIAGFTLAAGSAQAQIRLPTVQFAAGYAGCSVNNRGTVMLSPQLDNMTTLMAQIPAQNVYARFSVIQYLWNGTSWVGQVIGQSKVWGGIAVADKYYIFGWDEYDANMRRTGRYTLNSSPEWGLYVVLPAPNVIYRAIVDLYYEPLSTLPSGVVGSTVGSSYRLMSLGCYYSSSGDYPQSVR
jgi:hypothetical protein